MLKMSTIFRLFQFSSNPQLVRSFSTSLQDSAIKNVTIFGSGLMGGGIAQVSAQANLKTIVVDLNDELLAKSKKIIEESLKRVAKKKFKDDPSKAETFVSNSLGNLSFMTDHKKAVADADLVVEAIIENLEIKQKLFESLEKLAPEKTIFSSNTSSIPIGEIAGLSKRLDRFGGLHFFSPVPVMKLLEVIRIPQTSDQTTIAMNEWGKAIGKVTVQCKDTPGFIVNRLLLPFKLECIRMVERGDATFEDIDTAIKLGLGHPMGPFELSDFTGIDLGLFILEGWQKRFKDDPHYKVPEILRKMVKEGRLGRKAGKGWYNYQK